MKPVYGFIALLVVILYAGSLVIAEEAPNIEAAKAAAALLLINSTPSETWKKAEPSTASKITRSPYSMTGKLVRLKGVVMEIEQLPPIKDIPGDWYQLDMLADNPNSRFGVTGVYVIYIGDGSGIEPKSTVTCAGYFVGLEQGQNAFGGTVQGITIVSNAIMPATHSGHSKAGLQKTDIMPTPDDDIGHQNDSKPLIQFPAASGIHPAKIEKVAKTKHHKVAKKAASTAVTKPVDTSTLPRPTATEIIQKLHN
jgi:hypothetical protein